MVTEFRGRWDEIRVFPLSFSEFIEAYEGDKKDAFKNGSKVAQQARKKIDKEKIQIDVKTKNCSKTPNSRTIIKKCILAKDKKTNIKSIERLSITNKRTTPFNSFRFVLK